MVRKSYGPRRGTRKKLRAKKPTLTKFLQEFSIGERVAIDIQSNVKGFPHPRFQGLVGKVIGKRGKAYIVEVRNKDAKKIIITKPVHLKKV